MTQRGEPCGQRLVEAVAHIAPEVEARVRGATCGAATDDDLWREMTCCILSSQVPYELAVAAAERIASHGVFREQGAPAHTNLEPTIFQILLEPLQMGDGLRRYRFPRMRARHLARAYAAVSEEYGTLHELLKAQPTAYHARRSLIACAVGVGPKQSSMFLRNVGVSLDLAIIDRHVLSYLVRADVVPSLPRNLSSLEAYETIEQTLREHAADLGHSVGVLDWAIWIVMRAAAKVSWA